MYRGFHLLSLDPKGRIAVPKMYRDFLSKESDGRLILTSFKYSLWLYTLPEWEKAEKKLEELPSLKTQSRGLMHMVQAYATDCEMDGQGRILIPPPLRKIASLEKQVAFFGQINKFEIWDEQIWDNYIEGVRSQKDADLDEAPEFNNLKI